MGKMQRTKGATFEREIANALGVKRNIGQARDGGNDIDYPPFTIECKRYQKLMFRPAWMRQALAACTPERPTPVVITRGDGTEAMVVMRFTDWQGLVRASSSGGSALPLETPGGAPPEG